MHRSICSGWNNSGSVGLFESVAQIICIEGLVCHAGTKCQPFDQIIYTDDFAPLTGKEFNTYEVAQSVGKRQNFVVNPPFERPMA